MSSSYFLKIDKKKKVNDISLNIFDSLFLSGSSMLNSEILGSKGIEGKENDGYYYKIPQGKFKEIENEIKSKIDDYYKSMIKEISVIFMAEIKGVNEKKMKELEEDFTTNLFPSFKEDINKLINYINNLSNNKNLVYDVVKLKAVIISLNSENIKDNIESYKNYDIYQKYIKEYGEENLINDIYKNVLSMRNNSLKLIGKILFLQELFMNYPNKYINKNYINESLLYYYDEILNLIDIFLFIKVGEIKELDIIYR